MDQYASIPDWVTHLLETMLRKLKTGQEEASAAYATTDATMATPQAKTEVGQLASPTRSLVLTPSTQVTTTVQYSPSTESIFGAYPIRFFAVPPEPPPLPADETETEEINNTSGWHHDPL